MLIVRRSQLIIDFVLTLQFFNLLFTIWDNWHFPVSLLWWLTRFAETGIMIFGGRYFCRVRELRPIEFGMYELVPTTTQQQEDLERQQPENGVDNSWWYLENRVSIFNPIYKRTTATTHLLLPSKYQYIQLVPRTSANISPWISFNYYQFFEHFLSVTT